MSTTKLPWFERIRRNHALEHATMHLLARYQPGVQLVGRTDQNGFYIYGAVETDTLKKAAHEALSRLQCGETHLAVHPRCGTNLATAGLLAGLASFIVMLRRDRPPSDKLPQVLLASVSAVVLAQPIGAILQSRLTTAVSPANMTVQRVIPGRFRKMPLHRVVLRQG